MKSFINKCLIGLLVVAAIVGVERLSHTLTDGFSYPNITSSLPYNPKWDITFEPEDLLELETALDQPFSYLESGSQSYVFISEDNNYVLKFFKHKRWRMNPLYEKLPLPRKFAEKRDRWKRKKKETVASTFGSCKIAYTTFKNETGVIFVHLNKNTPFDHTVILKDRIGLKHHIQLEDVEFVVQKKAIPTGEYLLSLKEEGKTQEAQKALKELLAFTEMRAKKGFSDKDPHLIRNFGFINGKAVELDIGGFHRDPKKNLEYFYNHEVKKIHHKLLPWLQENYPELVPIAQEELKRSKTAVKIN